MSKDSWKAGINENTGIIFSDKTTEAQRNAAQKANQKIFEEFGDEARKYYNSIAGQMEKDAMVERLAKKQRQKELMKSAGKGPSNVSQAKMKQGMGKMGIGMKNNRGGSILKTNKEKMSYGGMSGGKKHMYVAGGSVTDNAGLRALKKASPEAYANIKRNS